MATTDILSALISSSGLSYRALSAKTGGRITASRIGDICTQRRAPAKLSEFIAICLACGANPDEQLQNISKRASEIDRASLASSSFGSASPMIQSFTGDVDDLLDGQELAAKEGDAH
ncbi:MAG: hypothetical protein K2I40_06185, partial [Bifidobacterium castoris]|nr:hypothetical protein [Bifidobacterium castoris]